MRCKCSNTARLSCMLFLIAVYFLVELIVGYAIHSLSLVADAFHMLSDFIALVVGLAAARIAKWPSSSKNTFGWQRAEVMGGLINSVMLITLCVTILLQAVQRFIETQSIDNPLLMIYVGTGGLVINILGLLVLGVHSHDGPEKSIEVTVDEAFEAISVEEPLRTDEEIEFYNVSPRSNGAVVPIGNTILPRAIGNNSTGNEATHVHQNAQLQSIPKHNLRKSAKHAKSLNMRAVFMHVLADFFGSVIVLTSALLLEFAPGDISAEGSWKLYVDPAMSVLMVIIILGSSVPITYKAALILLQSVPSEICLKHLKEKLEKIEGIHRVHDLHVWRLQSNCIIGTVHIRCASLPDYLNIARKVKELFHDFDIHCTTIQPEFEEYSDQEAERAIDYQTCVLDCGPNKNCQSDTCCPAPLANGNSRLATVDESRIAGNPEQQFGDNNNNNGNKRCACTAVQSSPGQEEQSGSRDHHQQFTSV